MTFFPDLPPLPVPDDDEQEAHQPEWDAPPATRLGGRLAHAAVLARTDDVAVVLTGVSAHPTGVVLEVGWMRRRRGQGQRDWAEASQEFHGRTGPGVEDPSGSLRFGVRDASGAVALTDPTQPWALVDPEHPPTGPVLTLREQGGHGDGSLDVSSGELWLWPLPPTGPLQLVVTWPSVGIGEEWHELDGAALRAAAGRAQPIWPDET